MPGPVPKKPSQRRRRNKPAGGEWQTLDGQPFAGERPRKPGGLHAFAQSWWDAAWASPVSSQWELDDRLEVVRLVKLAERIDRDVDRPGWVDSEFRHLLDRLGLTRSGRLKNRYELPEPQDDEDDQGGEVVTSARWGHLTPVDGA